MFVIALHVLNYHHWKLIRMCDHVGYCLVRYITQQPQFNSLATDVASQHLWSPEWLPNILLLKTRNNDRNVQQTQHSFRPTEKMVTLSAVPKHQGCYSKRLPALKHTCMQIRALGLPLKEITIILSTPQYKIHLLQMNHLAQVWQPTILPGEDTCK